MGSKSFSLDVADLVNLFKNALLVASAAFLTALANGLGSLDLGAYTPLVVPVVAVVLDTLIKWTKDNSGVAKEPKE